MTYTWGWFLGIVGTVTGLIMLFGQVSIWGLPLVMLSVFIYVFNAAGLVALETRALNQGEAEDGEAD